jgi:hypothetical protein
MVTTCEKIKFQKYGGILYVAETAGLDITGDSEDGVLTVSKIVFTSDSDLYDVRINEVSARHLRQSLVLIKDKV